MEKLSHAYIVSSASENARMGKAFYLAEKMLCQSEGERPCGASPTIRASRKRRYWSIRCVQWAPTPTFCRTRPPKRYIS